MEGWLKENKVYVITVGSMVSGVLLLYLFILSPISSESEMIHAKLRMQENVYRSKAQRGVPDEGALSDARRELNAERAALKNEVTRVQVALEKKFLSKGDDGYRAKFEEMKLTVRDRLRDLNGKRGLGEFPSDLGWQGVSLDSKEEGREALLRLGVGQGVLEALISSLGKGEKIESVNIFEDWDRNQEEEKATFLRRIPVRVKVKAASRSIFQAVHRFQKAGSYFNLEAMKVTQEATTGGDLLEVDMVLSGILIDPDAPPPVMASEEEY